MNLIRRFFTLGKMLRGVRAARLANRSLVHPTLSLFDGDVRLKGFCGILRLSKKDADTFVSWAKKQDPINNNYAEEANNFTFGSYSSVLVMRNGRISKPNILFGKSIKSHLVDTLYLSYVQFKGGVTFLSIFVAPFEDYSRKFTEPVDLNALTFRPRLCLNPFSKNFLFIDIPNEDYEARIEIGKRFIDARNEIERLAKFIFNSVGIQKDTSQLFLEAAFRYNSIHPYSEKEVGLSSSLKFIIPRFVASLDDRGISEDPAEISFKNRQTDKFDADAFFIKSELDDASKKGGLPTYKDILLDFKMSHLESSIVLCLWKEIKALSIANSGPLLDIPEISNNGNAETLRYLRHEITLISRAAHGLLFHFKDKKPVIVKKEIECLIDYIEEIKLTIQEQSSFSGHVASEAILKSQKKMSWLMLTLVVAQIFLGGLALFGPYSAEDISAVLGNFFSAKGVVSNHPK